MPNPAVLRIYIMHRFYHYYLTYERNANGQVLVKAQVADNFPEVCRLLYYFLYT